jgi:hypothetical protein
VKPKIIYRWFASVGYVWAKVDPASIPVPPGIYIAIRIGRTA